MTKDCSIAVPVAQVVEPKVLQSMMALVNYSAHNGINIQDIGITERCLIDDARNTLTETFLSSPTEWLFWMDSDMTFPKDTLVKLFETAQKKDAKMVTGIYYQRRGGNLPCLWSRNQETEAGLVTGLNTPKGIENKYMGSFMIVHPDKKEPFEAHAAGFGCVLVHRSVFEVMDRPWFQFIKGICSEDFYFFVHAQELGFKLWVEPTIDLGHIGDAPVVTKADFNKKAAQAKLHIEAIK
jgi:hypothetical protein